MEDFKLKSFEKKEKDYNNITILDEMINNRILKLFEAVSKEQKEKGQREMAKKEIDVFYQLRKYLHNKWDNKKLSKEDFLQKKEEFKRLNWLMDTGTTIAAESDKDIKNYIKNVSDNDLKWPAVKHEKENNNCLRQPYGEMPYFAFSKLKLDKEETESDFGFKTSTKELRKNIRKFIVAHEYGHLYEFLKSVIETGEGEVVDTVNGDTLDIIDSEGKANAFALDNMYRKDRRELLKNSKGYNKKEILKSFNRINNLKRGKESDATYFDLYKTGTAMNSKTLKKTLDSIEKEKNNYFDY